MKVRLKEVADVDVTRSLGKAEGMRVAHWKNAGSSEEWFFTTDLGCACGVSTFRDNEILLAASMPFEGEPPDSLAPSLGIDQISRAPRVFIDNWSLESK